jgi:hypothetical protein
MSKGDEECLDRAEARMRAIEERKTAQLKINNTLLAALESKFDSLLLSVDSSSPIPPQPTATGRNPGHAAARSGLFQVKYTPAVQTIPNQNQHDRMNLDHMMELSLGLSSLQQYRFPWRLRAIAR